MSEIAWRYKPFACKFGFHSWCHDSYRGHFCNFCFKEVLYIPGSIDV